MMLRPDVIEYPPLGEMGAGPGSTARVSVRKAASGHWRTSRSRSVRGTPLSGNRFVIRFRKERLGRSTQTYVSNALFAGSPRNGRQPPLQKVRSDRAPPDSPKYG